MRHKIVYSLLCGVIAGIVIDYIQLLAYYVVFPNTQEVLELIIGLVIGSGTLVAIVAIRFKNKSIVISLLRWMVIMISFALNVVLNGYVGTINFLLEITRSTINAATENVIGLLTLMSTIAIFGNALMVVIIRDAVFRIHRKLHKSEADTDRDILL